MFAFQLRKDILFRTSLIAMILFNTLAHQPRRVQRKIQRVEIVEGWVQKYKQVNITDRTGLPASHSILRVFLCTFE